MKTLGSLMLMVVLGASTVHAEPPAKKAPPATTADEISKADAEKFLVFFNKLVDVIVKNQDSCPKMATGINAVLDANAALLAKATEMKASGKKIPKAYEAKMEARSKELGPAMEKCAMDKDVQAAFLRMDGRTNDTKDAKKPDAPAPAPKPKK